MSRVIFGLNTLIIMNTAYYENGIIQQNRSSIMLNFIKNHLIFEVLINSCLWFNPLGFSLLRFLFVIKVISFYDIIEKFTESLQFSPKYNLTIKLSTLLVEVIILCHFFACLWYSVGDYQQKNEAQSNWLRSQNLEDQPISTQYISSMYFSVVTIGTIGYGDIVPQNKIERGILAGMAILSSGVFAYILSNIQNVYRKYNQKQKAYVKCLTDLNRFMANRSVNPILQQMARKYLKYVHDQNFRKGEVPYESLNVLSKHLREEITSEIFNKTINQIKIFNSFSSQFKQQLAQKMTEYTYGPDEFILKMNQLQEPQIIFVLKGNIQISIDQGKYAYNQEKQKEPFHICKQNQSLGEYEFISQQQISTFNARSIGITTTHQIKLSEFLELLKYHSNDREIYQQLKDSLNLYEQYSIGNFYCYSCKSSKHLINECPLFFYKPLKLRIINLQNRNLQKSILQFERAKNRLKFSSLLFQKGIEDTTLAFQKQNQDELSLFSSMNSLQEDNPEEKQISIKHFQSLKIISNQDQGQIENTSSHENIPIIKTIQDLKNYQDSIYFNQYLKQILIYYQTKANKSQHNLVENENLNETKQSYQETQIEKPQHKFQFVATAATTTKSKKMKEYEENVKTFSQKKIDEDKFNTTLNHYSSKKIIEQRKTNNIISQVKINPNFNNNNNNQNKQSEQLDEDLVTDTIRSYTKYMIHNNVDVILRKIIMSNFKAKDKTKKNNFTFI